MENLIILKQKENPFFHRKEIEISIESNATPKMNEAEEIIAKEFSTHPENVKIKNIKGRFGSQKFLIFSNIYSSKEEKDRTEPKSKKDRNKKENKAEEKKE